jgi:hypothetical protein
MAANMHVFMKISRTGKIKILRLVDYTKAEGT